MSPENKDLRLLLTDSAAARTIIAWLRDKRDDAKDTYEQLVQAAMYDEKRLTYMRVAYGKFVAFDALYNEAVDLTNPE